MTSKEKLEDHLSTIHGLSGDSLRLKMEEWKLRGRPIWGCGFCSELSNNINDRLSHIERHYEEGFSETQWDYSRVVHGMLKTTFVTK